MPTIKGGTVLGALVLAGLALGQIAPARASASVVLRYHFTQGQRTSYVVTASPPSADAAGMSSALSLEGRLSFSLKVLKVFADGSASVRADYGSGTLTLNGMNTALPLKGVYAVEHVATDGRVLSTKTYGLPASLGSANLEISGTGMPTLPAGPVGVGSTWTSTQAVSLGSLGSVSGTQRLRLVAFGSNHGRQTAVIRASGNLPFTININGFGMSGTAATSTDTTLYTSDGMLVGVHGTVKLQSTLDTGSGSGGGSDLSLVEKVDVVQGR